MSQTLDIFTKTQQTCTVQGHGMDLLAEEMSPKKPFLLLEDNIFFSIAWSKSTLMR
jgi:hypothetical protein